MPNVKIKVRKTGLEQIEFYTTSDENGFYKIAVPAGEYIVTLTDPNFYYGEASQNKPITLAEQQCEVKNFYLINDSRIEGKVIDSLGKPVTNVSVHLIPIGKNRNDDDFGYELSLTFRTGRFVFSGLSPGLYQISLNYVDKPDEDTPYPTFFYPYTTNRDAAEIIEIKYGTKLKDLVFQLPPILKKRKITGTVLWEDGKPAKNAQVDLIDVEFDDDISYLNKIYTDSAGKFEMEGFEGRKYKLVATVFDKTKNSTVRFVFAETKSREFILNETNSDFKITLINK